MARSDVISNGVGKDVLSNLPDNKRMVIEKAKNSRGSSTNNKSATSYMSQPNVQEFNRQMQRRIFIG